MGTEQPNLISLNLRREEDVAEVRRIKEVALDLLKIKEIELNDLRLRIQRNNGIVRVFIHPFFHQYLERYSPDTKRPDYN